MRAIADPSDALGRGLASIRSEFQIPEGFPPAVLAAAEQASKRVPADHEDRTDWPFVTLDPQSSTDLDQAFTLERDGPDLLLRYAIADVAWFVDDGDRVDTEAWRRGTTQYLPDGKAGLYPPVLSEGAASLLPGGPRPAVIFSVRVAQDGEAQLDGAERAIIRSRAKLAYDSVRESDLPPGFAELALRIQAAEARRGASRVNPPAQELAALGGGRFELLFRPPLESEVRNAALSLAANLAVADLLHAHRTGLFRIMAEPDSRAVARLRHAARGLGLSWPDSAPLASSSEAWTPPIPGRRRSCSRSSAPVRAPPTSRSGRASGPGIRRSPPPTPTRRRRFDASPTATSSGPRSPLPTAGRCRPRSPRPSKGSRR